MSKPGCTVAVYWDSENKHWVAERTGGDLSGVAKQRYRRGYVWGGEKVRGDMSRVAKKMRGDFSMIR